MGDKSQMSREEYDFLIIKYINYIEENSCEIKYFFKFS